MMTAAEASLRRLSTRYVDLCSMHIWAQPTPAEEIIRGFDDLVREGKVLYGWSFRYCRLKDCQGKYSPGRSRLVSVRRIAN
jgi:aryl-alcohol dehydrogenase-like predicted oxidoreductase